MIMYCIKSYFHPSSFALLLELILIFTLLYRSDMTVITTIRRNAILFIFESKWYPLCSPFAFLCHYTMLSLVNFPPDQLFFHLFLLPRSCANGAKVMCSPGVHLPCHLHLQQQHRRLP